MSTVREGMMRQFVFGWAIIAAFILCPSCSAEPDATVFALQGILQTGWQEYTSDKPAFPGGLAMRIVSPRGSYFLSTGMGDAISEDCHFRIASVTKTFTAAAIMLLYRRGALDLDARITDTIPGKDIPYVPATSAYDLPHKEGITIRMLLMHRAGVFDISNNPIPDNEFSRGEKYVGSSYLDYMMGLDRAHTFTFDELVGVAARCRLSFFAPGEAYHYSDTGYSILGKIIERVSGKPYGDFITEELLLPNGLSHTTVPWNGSDQALPELFVRGYVWMDAGRIEDVTASNMSPHTAEGNIISTAADLSSWCRKLFAGEAGLDKQTVAQMMDGMSTGDAHDSKYGLGISCMPTAGYGHAGAHEGYLTLMYYRPETDSVYVMFANNWNVAEGLDSIKTQIKTMMAIADKIIAHMDAASPR